MDGSTIFHVPPAPVMEGRTRRVHAPGLLMVTGQVFVLPVRVLVEKASVGVLLVFAVAAMVGDPTEPESQTASCGKAGSLLPMASDPVAAPLLVGENCMVRFRDSPGARVRGRAGGETNEKPLPTMLKLLMTRELWASGALVICSGRLVLDPVQVVPKVSSSSDARIRDGRGT